MEKKAHIIDPNWTHPGNPKWGIKRIKVETSIVNNRAVFFSFETRGETGEAWTHLSRDEAENLYESLGDILGIDQPVPQEERPAPPQPKLWNNETFRQLNVEVDSPGVRLFLREDDVYLNHREALSLAKWFKKYAKWFKRQGFYKNC